MALSELTDDPLWPTVRAARVQMGSPQQLRQRPHVNLGLWCSHFQMLRFIWGRGGQLPRSLGGQRAPPSAAVPSYGLLSQSLLLVLSKHTRSCLRVKG